MKTKITQFIFITFIFSLLGIVVSAQSQNCYRLTENKRDPYPEQIKEKLAKLCIEQAKKDFQKLLDKGEEVAKLTEELEVSFEKNKKFTSNDNKKLKRVEKLMKKIRSDLKGEDDDKEEEKPESVLDAVKKLKEKTSKLFKELKKTSRHSISAVAIQSSNKVLRLVRFLRFTK